MSVIDFREGGRASDLLVWIVADEIVHSAGKSLRGGNFGGSRSIELHPHHCRILILARRAELKDGSIFRQKKGVPGAGKGLVRKKLHREFGLAAVGFKTQRQIEKCGPGLRFESGFGAAGAALSGVRLTLARGVVERSFCG